MSSLFRDQSFYRSFWVVLPLCHFQKHFRHGNQGSFCREQMPTAFASSPTKASCGSLNVDLWDSHRHLSSAPRQSLAKWYDKWAKEDKTIQNMQISVRLQPEHSRAMQGYLSRTYHMSGHIRILPGLLNVLLVSGNCEVRVYDVCVCDGAACPYAVLRAPNLHNSRTKLYNGYQWIIIDYNYDGMI